ncbi:MAG: hypothetical protein R3F17_00275 [Planctomycetota bacterium]
MLQLGQVDFALAGGGFGVDPHLCTFASFKAEGALGPSRGPDPGVAA